MTPLEAADPLFQFVCRMNRACRKGVPLDMNATRSEAIGLLDAFKGSGVDLDDKLGMVLAFFIDETVQTSELPFAYEWPLIAEERYQGAWGGGDKFFEMLDEELQSAKPDTAERLRVYYTCMGLGFQGSYVGQTEQLRAKANTIAARLRNVQGGDLTRKITPNTYEHTDRRNLVSDTRSWVSGLAVALVGMVVVLFVSNIVLYRSASSQIQSALDRINSQGQVQTSVADPDKP